MTERIQQLFVNTGARGIGKTRLSLTFFPPSKRHEVVIMDSEKSANNVRMELKRRGHADFGMYIDLEDVEHRYGLPDENDSLDRISRDELPWANEKERDAMLLYYRYILKTLTEIPKDKYKVFILDTGQKFEYGMRAWVDLNMAKYGLSKDWAKAEANLLRPLYESLLNAIWGRGIETIILNFHLRNVWDKRTKSPIPNKVQIAGNPAVLYQRSSLMLWLVPEAKNPNGEPAGLVLKERLGKFDIDLAADRYIQRRMLPYRIPTCDWEHIEQYLEHGCNLQNPAEGETWSDEERDMASELLNNAQMKLMLKDLEIKEMEQAVAMAEMGLMGTNFGSDTKPIELSINGSKPTSRAEALKAWTGMGRKIPNLLPKLSGLTDEQIAESWQKIVEE